MRKFCSILLAVLMIVSLVACGGNSESENEQDSQETAGVAAGSETGEAEGGSEPSSEDMSFEDALNHSGDIDNYYFELIMESQGEEYQNAKMWVMDSKMKFEIAGQISYYDFSEGTAAFYSEDTNQVILMPVGEMEEMETPFTVEEDLDASDFDSFYYKGTETLEGKTVYVYEYSVAGYSVKYYLWADTGIIVKMETDSGEYKDSYYFKDLTLDCVSESDFEYPAGAEVVDMSGFGS